MKHLFTSESVSEGHPDKIADQISDAILDAMLKDDPNSRVAVESLVTTGLAIVSGEVSTKSYVDIQEVVRQVIRDIGYTRQVTGLMQIHAECYRRFTSKAPILHKVSIQTVIKPREQVTRE
jgi:S-adenosylmethionine synthetase